MRVVFLGLALLVFLFAGCAETGPPAQPVAQATTALQALITPQPTATDTPVPTATATPSPTQTPSPTPTPTATAVPAQLFGDPRTMRLTAEPEPRSGASCGIVDVFDFPIAPPDGLGVSRGGGDFGRYRDRYGKYHAGEDWGAPGEGSNFGKPVYNIGHGRVMYAQPEGWNRDKGVVIIEHVLENRQVIYSFYGHLDPPSVVLEPGTCVRRGDHVGNIGKPRTSPHLHFEMRTHMPYAPGPGYWEEDPTTAGWLPPSQTIWNQRMASSPGVAWLRLGAEYSQPLGLLRESTFLTIENGRLTQTNLATGASQHSPLVGKEVENGLIHEQTNTLFLETEDGLLLAFADSLSWEYELEGNGRSDLLPLPNGGVLVVNNGDAVGLSGGGDVLWRADMGKQPFAWTLTDDSLYFTLTGSNGGTWVVTQAQPPVLVSEQTGHPVAVGEAVWLYTKDGIYRLNAGSAELLYTLPTARSNFSTATNLPDGGALVFHTDDYDRRLIAFNPDGTVRWDLSVSSLLHGTPQLVNTAGQTLLFIHGSDGNNLQTLVYEVDAQTGKLTHIFNGGSRPYTWDDIWMMSAGDQVLINSAGGAILALNPQQAVNAIIAASPPN
jgi:murein DD-endopeptidase MepM/ murein hydrolase activator NlpD